MSLLGPYFLLHHSGQYGSVSTQVLQQFDVNSHVMVTDIRGQVNVRYLHLDVRWSKIEKNGKRGVSYIAAIADTKANASSRAAESDANVQWVHQSGYCIKFTEVNETTIDVAYDRCSQCESEAHAQLLFVDWAQVVCRWSQRMTSSKLIEPGQ
ncbi:LOW QUALITY PROTEIN: Hypothetical protein PHPALM_6267 [Phytophthora palmivora]|uniref:Uncharacterized protein n=1 Tax=Phytophthora palmivora TaxID=4796 RepID=A0A2P4YF92_9STRA|nr:LOW QUALITY PROTEIN: Hypothetical protein PHPALM_6267 [Phytophthora palmivora]